MSFEHLSANQPGLFAESGSASPAPRVKSARSANRAAWWEQDLSRTATYLMGQARSDEERAFVERLYDEAMAEGPDFINYRGKSAKSGTQTRCRTGSIRTPMTNGSSGFARSVSSFPAPNFALSAKGTMNLGLFPTRQAATRRGSPLALWAARRLRRCLTARFDLRHFVWPARRCGTQGLTLRALPGGVRRARRALSLRPSAAGMDTNRLTEVVRSSSPCQGDLMPSTIEQGSVILH